MAIKPNDKFPANTNAPGAGYTYGSARNIVTPGDNTGTPLDEFILNDIWGLFQALLKSSGVFASGTPETEDRSQYYESILELIANNTFEKGVLTGLTVENDISAPLTRIKFNPGVARSSTLPEFVTLNSPTVKLINAPWERGNNKGGLLIGSVAADRTYHLFVFKNDSSGVIDAGFDIDPEGINVPNGWSVFARVASIRTDNTSAIIQFIQDGDKFILKRPINIRNAYFAGPNSPTLSIDTNTPKGIGGTVIINVSDYLDTNDNAQSHTVISGTQQTNLAPVSNGPLNTYTLNNNAGDGYRRSYYANLRLEVPIQNDDSKFRFRYTRTGSKNGQYQIVNTIAWTDKRGKV